MSNGELRARYVGRLQRFLEALLRARVTEEGLQTIADIAFRR